MFWSAVGAVALCVVVAIVWVALLAVQVRDYDRIYPGVSVFDIDVGGMTLEEARDVIEEYGKDTLPYLSKSGGEKVKSSLSAILSLAEIKSTQAGIQLGMLFIDEPPFLDDDGTQAYCDALETIQSRYKDLKIMAITHDPTFKARFPQNLDVIKTENGSKVIFE